MHDDAVALGNVLDEIVELCEKIEQQVKEAQWEQAGQMLAQRQTLLEQVFARTPEDPQQVARLVEVAKKVSAFDREVMPLANAAMSETTSELKNLRRGRMAAQLYEQNSS